MEQDAHGAVVVGVDGSDAGGYALGWAADEAELRGLPLLVVHAGDLGAVGEQLTGPTASTALHEVCNYGHELLADAVATLADTHPRVEVTTRLVETRPATLLNELSESAALVVVGRGNQRRLAGLLLGSTAHRVAARAHCPTVIVSRAVSPDVTAIAVGVSLSAGGVQAMRFACAEAALRGSEVLAIRSWTDADWALADLGLDGALSFDAWRDAQQNVLDSWLARARQEFPQVSLTGSLTSLPVTLALERSELDASLVVLGCRRSDDATLPRLGPVASWLTQHTECPVVIVGHDTGTEPSDEPASR